jgi:hypothetical protein
MNLPCLTRAFLQFLLRHYPYSPLMSMLHTQASAVKPKRLFMDALAARPHGIAIAPET